MPHGVPMSWMASYFAHPPVWVDEGHGAHFTCADGRRFLDTNVGDKSTFCGIDPEPVVRAVQRRVAAGSQFMLPTEDAIVVAEELARRWRLPSWQFTLSASQANTEALRLARHATGRRKVLTFTGNYGGHGDEMLTAFAGEGRLSYLGLAPAADRDIDVIGFNDAGALERALAGGDYACVFTEPALTNEGVVLPEPGFHDALRELTRAPGHPAPPRRDAHADLRPRRPHGELAPGARRRGGRQGGRRRTAARRLRHDRRALPRPSSAVRASPASRESSPPAARCSPTRSAWRRHGRC